MSTDSSGSQFTITEIRIDDPRMNEYDELPEEEKQSSFVAIIRLLPGSDRLEIEEMDGQLAWGHSKLSIEDFASIEALGLRGRLIASGYCCLGQKPLHSRTLIVARHQLKSPVDLLQPNNCQVIYYQVGGEWRKYPEEAPVLKKRVRLTVDPSNPGSVFHVGGGLFRVRVGRGWRALQLGGLERRRQTRAWSGLAMSGLFVKLRGRAAEAQR